MTVLDEDGEQTDDFHVVNTATGHEELSDRLNAGVQVWIEACDMAYPVVGYLLRENIEVQVGHPKKLSNDGSRLQRRRP